MSRDESTEAPDAEMGELEKWGRAAVSAPVLTSLVASYVTEKTAQAIGADGGTLEPIADDLTENLQSKMDWLEGEAQHVVARISGAAKRADDYVDQIGDQWRSEVGRLYARAADQAQVSAVESGVRDGFTGSMRHYEISGATDRRMYLDAWRWSKGWVGHMVRLRKDVRSQVGLRLAEVNAGFAVRRSQAVQTSDATAGGVTSVASRGSDVERLRDGLRAIAEYTESTSDGLEAMIATIEDRIQTIDALFNEASHDGRNLTDSLMHASSATRTAADALLLAAAESREQADRL